MATEHRNPAAPLLLPSRRQGQEPLTPTAACGSVFNSQHLSGERCSHGRRGRGSSFCSGRRAPRRYVSRYTPASQSRMAAAAAQAARPFFIVLLVAAAASFLPRLAGASTEAAAASAGRGVTLRVGPRQVRPYEPTADMVIH